MIANSIAGEVTISIGGKEYWLLFDHAAIARLQTLLGVQTWAIKMGQALDAWEMPVVDQILAIGLEARQPGLFTPESLAEVRNPVIPRNPTVRAIIAAMQLSSWGPDGRPPEEIPPVDPLMGRRGIRSLWPFVRDSGRA